MIDAPTLGLLFLESAEVKGFDTLHNVRVDTKRFVDRVHLVYWSPTNKLVASVLIWACKLCFTVLIWACERRAVAPLLGGVKNTLQRQTYTEDEGKTESF